MHVPLLTAGLHAGPVPAETLAGNKSLSEEEKLGEASRQFEALLLRQILSQGRKTIFSSKFNQASNISNIYQEMVTERLADSISQSGSFGLARSLQAQLVRQDPASAGAHTEAGAGASAPLIKKKLNQLKSSSSAPGGSATAPDPS